MIFKYNGISIAISKVERIYSSFRIEHYRFDNPCVTVEASGTVESKRTGQSLGTGRIRECLMTPDRALRMEFGEPGSVLDFIRLITKDGKFSPTKSVRPVSLSIQSRNLILEDGQNQRTVFDVDFCISFNIKNPISVDDRLQDMDFYRRSDKMDSVRLGTVDGVKRRNISHLKLNYVEKFHDWDPMFFADMNPIGSDFERIEMCFMYPKSPHGLSGGPTEAALRWVDVERKPKP